MELCGISRAAMYTVVAQGIDNVPYEEETASFQRYMEELQIKSDIVSHLKGVPLNTVTIPPNIIEKMATDQAAYTYYMNAMMNLCVGISNITAGCCTNVIFYHRRRKILHPG